MPKKNKLSVILTSYNHAKYLRESIDSILNQTYSDFELIIWDDASTDKSWQIINTYSDPRIRAFRNEINRQVDYLNEAISDVAKGQYIAIHHSDDIWELEKLEKQVAFLDANPQIGAVFTWAQIIDEDGQPFPDQNHFYYKIFEQPNRTRHEWLNYFFYYGNALCHPSVLIRRQCYKDAGSYRYAMAQIPDFDMWVRLCLKYDIHILPEKLIRFRVRSNEMNASGIRSDTRIRRQFEFLQVLNNYKNIPSFQEFTSIFPNAEKYLKPQGHDLAFALGMVALESKTNQITKLFGLNILFEIFNDPDRAKKIKELYDFSYQDFIALTAQYDVFSTELINSLTAQINSLTTQVQSLTYKEVALNQILQSRSWKFVQMLQRLRLRIIPIGSRRERLLKIVWRGLRQLRSQGLSAFLRKSVAYILGKSSWYNRLQNARRSSFKKSNLKYKPVRGLPVHLREKARQIEESGFFDYEWYLTDNPDVLNAAINPVEHYLMHGIKDERNPNPLFNTSIYAKSSGIMREEALLHFAESGRLFAPGAYHHAEVLMTAQKKYLEGLQMKCEKDDRSQNRKYAVFLQCGAGSLHEKWLTQNSKDWDLLVNHYDHTHLGNIPCDVEFKQSSNQPGTKSTGFHALLENWPQIIESYEYVLLLDDDIFMEEKDISRLFQIADENKLHLAQASLSSNSICAHTIFRNSGKPGIRYVTGVEIMMPVLSRHAIKMGRQLFAQAISGWGVDFVLGKLVGLAGKAAVIDDVIASHTKPINVENGAFYRMLHQAYIYPEIELTNLQRIYGVERSFYHVKN